MQFSAVTRAALLFIAINSVAAAPIAQINQQIVGTSIDTASHSTQGGAAGTHVFSASSTDGGNTNTSGGTTTTSQGNAVAFGSNSAHAATDEGHSDSTGFSGSDSRGYAPIVETNANTNCVGEHCSAGQNSIGSANNWGGASTGNSGSSAFTQPNGQVGASVGSVGNNIGSGSSTNSAGAGLTAQIWREKGTAQLNTGATAQNGGFAGASLNTGGNIDPHMTTTGDTQTSGNGDATAKGFSNVDIVGSTVHDFHK